MGFFKWLGGASPDEKQARAEMQKRIEETRALEMQRQDMDLGLLSAGGIPSEAKARLQELGRTAGEKDAIFTSNLAPDELALLRRHGYRPRGLVTGSAVWHVGQAYAGTTDCEVVQLSQAYDQATHLAVSRLKQERDLIGAHGVVGVRLTMVRHEWSGKTIEVQLVGTAVQGPSPPPYGPFLSDLSGQEWWALHNAGYDTVDLVWGYCTWFLFTTATDDLNMRGWNNIEMSHWSNGLSRARTRALEYLYNRARAEHCDGVTGVTVERHINEVRLTGPYEDPSFEREHHNLVVSIIGTTVRERPDAAEKRGRTRPVLSLKDGKIKPMVLTTTDVTLYD